MASSVSRSNTIISLAIWLNMGWAAIFLVLVFGPFDPPYELVIALCLLGPTLALISAVWAVLGPLATRQIRRPVRTTLWILIVLGPALMLGAFLWA